MSNLSKKITKWLKEHNDAQISFEIESDIKINIKSYQYVMTVIIPKNYPADTDYIISTLSQSMNFKLLIADLNDYVQEKKRNLPTLFNRINTLVSRKKDILMKKEELLDEDLDQLSDNLFDPKEHLLYKMLEDYNENKLKHYKVHHDKKVEKSIIKIFDKNNVAKIIVERFIETIKKYMEADTIEVTIDDYNIYKWNIKFHNFTNVKLQKELFELNKKYGYDYIEIEIILHQDYYPLYPIEAKVIRPRLLKSLMHKISNLKMIQLDYWNPSRKPIFIIEKLFNIFNANAEIDIDCELNDITINKNGAFYPLESDLIELATVGGEISFETDMLDDEVYKSVTHKKNNKNKSHRGNNAKAWSKGTGYGYDGIDDWDIEEFKKIQQEKDRRIENILASIITKIDESLENKNKYLLIVKAIEESCLIQFIKSYLFATTLLEISRHNDVYKKLFDIIHLLANNNSIHLIVNNGEKSIICMLETLYDQTIDFIKSVNIEDDTDSSIKIAKTIISLYEMINPLYIEFKSNTKKESLMNNDNASSKQEDDIKNEMVNINGIDVPAKLKKQYVKEMKHETFALANIVNDKEWPFIYKNKHSKEKSSGKAISASHAIRVGHDLGAIKNYCPIHYESTVVVRKDEDYSSVIRGCISGPDGTPYDSGLFFFDGYLHKSYPTSPPWFKFVNHGGHRHNPNLYDDGKVCLSLLGTWGGKEAESWSSDSTIPQVFVSIQSLILVKEPFYNEPGYERHAEEEHYIQASLEYILEMRIYNISDCMNQIIEKPFSSFEDFICKHFTLKRDYILELTKKWVQDAKDYEEKHGNKCKSRFHEFKNFYSRTLEQYERLKKNLDSAVLEKIINNICDSDDDNDDDSDDNNKN